MLSAARDWAKIAGTGGSGYAMEPYCRRTCTLGPPRPYHVAGEPANVLQASLKMFS